MIKTVNTEADYEALTRDTFESSAVFVRADNFAHIDGVNTITRHPQRGDIVVLDEDHERRYIRLSSFVLDRLSATWTIVGVVAAVNGKDVLEVHKTNTSKAWSSGYSWKLTGYTCDGTDRTGVISIREASNSWASNVAYTFNYNASTLEDFVSQLNTFFLGTSAFTTQDWVATINDNDEVILTCAYTSWQQASYNTASEGFSLTANLMSWYTPLAKILRVNGNRGGEGAISNMSRALTYFRQDLSSTTYNPSSDVTDIKRAYPICLPGYLGTSEYQSDHCAYLRSVYGAGEAGWKKFMASCLPVWPNRFGSMGEGYDDGLAITKKMAAEMRPTQAGTSVPFSPMAEYCQGIGYDCDGFRLGEWSAPTLAEVREILNGVEYNTTNNREADDLNKALYLIGGSAISNGSYLWSCGRVNAVFGWCAYGSNGFFGSYGVYSGGVVVPVAHHTLSDSED